MNILNGISGASFVLGIGCFMICILRGYELKSALAFGIGGIIFIAISVFGICATN